MMSLISQLGAPVGQSVSGDSSSKHTNREGESSKGSGRGFHALLQSGSAQDGRRDKATSRESPSDSFFPLVNSRDELSDQPILEPNPMTLTTSNQVLEIPHDLAEGVNQKINQVGLSNFSKDAPSMTESEFLSRIRLDDLPEDLQSLLKDVVRAKDLENAPVESLRNKAGESGSKIEKLIDQIIVIKRESIASGAGLAPHQSLESLKGIGGQSMNTDQSPQPQNLKGNAPLIQQVLLRLDQGTSSTESVFRHGELSLTSDLSQVNRSSNSFNHPPSLTFSTGDLRSSTPMELSPVVLSRNTSSPGTEMTTLLGERISYQVNKGIKEASIRLDPPELGKIDISVRSNNDRINIVINTNSSQTRDLLLQQADRLRMDLAQSQNDSVDIDIASHQDEGSGQRHSRSGNPESIETAEQNDNVSDQFSEDKETSDSNHWLSISA